ncbi:MAG: glycosyltransferase family 2 protein [Candidatus Omnitrophota bacterium]
MRLTIVIVNWNSAEYIERCLKSIFAQCHNLLFEIIVVDNASCDESVDLIKSKFKSVVLIENKNNPGFAAANNQAILKSNSEYVLFLNPDTEILDNAVGRMVDFLDKNKDFCGVGPCILNADGTIQFTCARNFPNPFTELCSYMSFLKNLRSRRPFGNYLMNYWDHRDSRQVNVLSGACMMFSHKVLAEINNFNEKYFMYAEDLDLCRAIKNKGGKLWYLSAAKIIHHGGKSSGLVTGLTYVRYYESMYFFYKQYHGIFVAVIYKYFLLFYALLVNLKARSKLIFARGKDVNFHRSKIRGTNNLINWCVRSGIN